MPEARDDYYSVPSGGDLYAGLPPPAPVQLVADGIWTWFTMPSAVYRNGATYIMAVDSAGTCRIHKYVHATQVTTSFSLSSTGLEIDDHNNGSLQFLSDGRIIAWYGKHNDDSGLRYRVSTNPEDISAWSAEQVRGGGAGNVSYPNPVVFSQGGPEYIFFRRNRNGGADRSLCYRTSPDFADLPATISAYQDVWASPVGDTPYWRLASDGVNTLHIAATDRHPVQGQSSLYHFSLRLDGSDEPEYFKSDGTEITASLPLGPSDATLVYDGSGTKCWVSDIAIDGDGRPRILYMRYPGNDGSAIEYWHARWTGSEWVRHKITDDGAGLYSGEAYYHGGLSFDSQDVNLVYLSAPISGVRQVQRWRTADDGATWAQQRVLTTGGTAGSPLRIRPVSPVGHDGTLPVIWPEGTYGSYTSFSMSVWGLR